MKMICEREGVEKKTFGRILYKIFFEWFFFFFVDKILRDGGVFHENRIIRYFIYL
jgi:hypothetical protein